MSVVLGAIVVGVMTAVVLGAVVPMMLGAGVVVVVVLQRTTTTPACPVGLMRSHPRRPESPDAQSLQVSRSPAVFRKRYTTMATSRAPATSNHGFVRKALKRDHLDL